MLVNCENSSTRRPSAISSGSISVKRSSLAEPLTLRACGSFSRRGSQQIWRSFSSASRNTMWLLARPLRSISSRTLACISTRTVS